MKRKMHFLTFSKLATETPAVGGHKRGFFNRGNGVHFGKKEKALIGFALIAVILVSCFIFYPRGNTTPVPPDDIETEPVASPDGTPQATNSTVAPTNPQSTPTTPWSPLPPLQNPDFSHQVIKNNNLTKETWLKVANFAWAYFKPGDQINSNTGLPGSGPWCPYFTDWDLGVYVQAVLDAQAIGLIGTTGEWNANYRLEKVVTFLENRELNATTHYPYWFYTGDGHNYKDESDKATDVVNICDTGRLLVALDNLKTYAAKNDPTLKTRIDNVIYNVNGNRSDYAALLPGINAESAYSINIYTYYVFAGFEAFWPTELAGVKARIIDNIMKSGTITTPENVTLPNGRLTGDPIYGALFDLKNNPPQFTHIMNQFYLAHEVFYNKTGIYRAFSEGPTGSTDWAYEWVVYDNKTWVVRTGDGDYNISPILYTKIAFSFLAVHNTTFARNIVIYLEERLEKPDNGYYNGLSEAGVALSDSGIHTDGLILGACKYALQHYPTP